MDLYSYSGPVMMFDRCVANSWQAETYAPSEKKRKATSRISSENKTV